MVYRCRRYALRRGAGCRHGRESLGGARGSIAAGAAAAVVAGVTPTTATKYLRALADEGLAVPPITIFGCVASAGRGERERKGWRARCRASSRCNVSLAASSRASGASLWPPGNGSYTSWIGLGNEPLESPTANIAFDAF